MYNNQSFIKPKPGIQLNRAHPLANGLVGYWPMNEGSGTIARDVAGSNNGTLTNFALGASATSNWIGSPMGGCLVYDGSDDFVNCGSSSLLNPPAMSFVLWVKTTSLAQAYQSPITRRVGTVGINYQWFVKSTGKIAVYISATGSVSYDGTGAFTLAINTWYQIAVTYDSSTGLKSYVNGLIDNTVAANGPIAVIDDITCIGKDPNSTRCWTGFIEEVRIYNRVLHPDEIKALYVNPHIDFHGSKTRLLAGAI